MCVSDQESELIGVLHSVYVRIVCVSRYKSLSLTKLITASFKWPAVFHRRVKMFYALCLIFKLLQERLQHVLIVHLKRATSALFRKPE